MTDAFLDKPVFIGGAARSGTTLIRNLLEGHKNVLVLPNEPTVMQHYNRLPEDARGSSSAATTCTPRRC